MSPLEIHKQIINTPSVSGNEAELADWVEKLICDLGAEPVRLGNNVMASWGGPPKLLFNSHLDTVPATDAWTRDPFTWAEEGGKLYGLGSNDAGASVAAMLWVFAERIPGVGIMLVEGEEVGGKGTEQAWSYAQAELGWKPNGVVIGEPTELQIGVKQRGLIAVNLVSHGEACHAANADQLGNENPIFRLARDLAKLPRLKLLAQGHTVQPTELTGASARNQVPAEARAALDIRTVPGYEPEQIVEELARELECEIEVRSTRLKAFETRTDSKLVQAITAINSIYQPFESRTMSDQVFFTGCNAVKWGPGVSARSHTSDEYVLKQELLEGADAYLALAKRVCA